MSKRIDRRTFVRSALTAGAGVLLAPSAGWSAAQKARLATEGAFAQGVASGEPATNAITLWTRLDGVTASANVGYEVAADAGFAKVVASGTAAADAAADFTVHQRVSGAFLKPGEPYYYRFKTALDSSPVGRFRTARPAGSSETVRIAFFSCQEFIAGFYAAHRDLAAQDVDLVVCLGDYIYEQAFASTGSANAPVRTDDSAADGEAQTLAEYRRKYSLYHSDANLREVRRHFALVGEWDDHEVEDNYAGDLPGGAAKNRRVPFGERRANGYRAWFEHMPRRLAGQPKIYGSLPLGGAELFVLDSRQYRGDQPCNPTDAALSAPCPPTTTDDPSRTLLGSEQKAWLKGALSASRALEGDRQPGDDLLARRTAAQPAEHRFVGRLRRRSSGAGGPHRCGRDRRRHLRHRRHPHLLRRRRHAHRPSDGARRGPGRPGQRPVAGDRVRRRGDHVAGHRRPRRVDGDRAGRGRRGGRRRGAGQQPASGLRQPGLQGLLHPRGGGPAAPRPPPGGAPGTRPPPPGPP